MTKFGKTLTLKMEMRELIEAAYQDRTLLTKQEYQQAVQEVIGLLDLGQLRVAEPVQDTWQVNDWVKKAVLLYFQVQPME